jgi:hypothetical protein
MDRNDKIVHGLNRAAKAGAARAASNGRIAEGRQDPKTTIAVDARTPEIYSWPQPQQPQQ